MALFFLAETTAGSWDYTIEDYAKNHNISYQEAKDKFAKAIRINQAADIIRILYGFKNPEGGKASSVAPAIASSIKRVLSVYDKFKQLIASGTKGNNDVLALAGTGDSGYFSFGESSISPVNLSKGTNGGNKQSGINETGKIEKILPPEKNWERARNKAIDIVGGLGADSLPVIGRMEISEGYSKVIGRQCNDKK